MCFFRTLQVSTVTTKERKLKFNHFHCMANHSIIFTAWPIIQSFSLHGQSFNHFHCMAIIVMALLNFCLRVKVMRIHGSIWLSIYFSAIAFPSKKEHFFPMSFSIWSSPLKTRCWMPSFLQASPIAFPCEISCSSAM